MILIPSDFTDEQMVFIQTIIDKIEALERRLLAIENDSNTKN